jgi:Mitochondrial K+-H+ exchange-related
MDVYLVPIGRDRYELYCEVPDEPEEPADERSSGFIHRMKARFAAMLAEAERERRRSHAEREAEERGLFARMKARLMRWVAESIAEQRLLWHLRRQAEACLYHPTDVEERHATTILRRQLGRDFDRHRLWLIVDSLLFIASGLLVLVPGPNLVGYYFAFRMVGHFLSLRGARQGLNVVQWAPRQSAPLTELRGAIDLDGEARARQVHDVANALKLEHLARFFERTAIPSA